MKIAKILRAIAAPNSHANWLLRLAALIGAVFLFALVASRVVDGDAFHWLSRLWPHYFVRWDESSGYPGATFPRFPELLAPGTYTSALILVSTFTALSVYSAVTKGRIVGVDVTIAAVAVLGTIIGAVYMGARLSIPRDTVAYLLFPLLAGSLLAAFRPGFDTRREAIIVAIGTLLCFSSFLWICVAFVNMVGDGS